jgi:hypothetical protein
MPLPKITIKTRKDGRQVARFRDNQGLVRTAPSMQGNAGSWVRAEQVKQLADYGIVLQVAQARAGIASDGQAMPPLKGGSRAVFVAAVNGRARFTRKTYGDWKAAHGLQPIRDLYGAGKGGHMLDDIRINYLDDRQSTIAITSKVSRDKARANEQRAPWWGWSTDSVRKLTAAAAEIFQTGVAEHLFAMGLIGASALSEAKRMWRKVA